MLVTQLTQLLLVAGALAFSGICWCCISCFILIVQTLTWIIYYCRKNYVYIKRDRLLPPKSASADDGASTSGVLSQPLSGAKFVVIGKLKKKKAELTRLITGSGGKLVTSVDKTVTACISNKGTNLWFTLMMQLILPDYLH